MNKKFAQVSIVFLFLLTACRQVNAGETPAATNTLVNAVDTPTLVQTPTNTITSIPTETPTASITPLPTIPTFTPTFDLATIVTVTPLPKAVCPKEDPLLKLPFKIDNTQVQMGQKVLDFLNQGGSVKTFLSAMPSSYYPEDVRYEDITGDGVPELMYSTYSGFGKFFIFTCSAGKYTIFEGAESILIVFDSVLDMNQNNIPELLVITRSCSGGGCWKYYLLEWNGNTFVDLAPDAWVDDALDKSIADINGDKLPELIVHSAPVPHFVSQPWREESHIFSWNGKNFAPQAVQGYLPRYGFQAIQDADQQTTLGAYDAALNLYKQVIFSDNLDWWSKERHEYEDAVVQAPWLHEPTPSVQPQEDKSEYPRLAAYAYYRIMLLRLVQGQEKDAETVYQTLQQKFANDEYAHPYAGMATAFWNAYQSTHKMYDGCAAAIQFAAEHPEILKPMGSDYHGSQSHIYAPADVCPFR